jgi:hypothetical protein
MRVTKIGARGLTTEPENSPPLPYDEAASYRALAVRVLSQALFDAEVFYGKRVDLMDSQERAHKFGYPSSYTYLVCDPDMVRFWCLVAGVPVDKFHRAFALVQEGKLRPREVKRLCHAANVEYGNDAAKREINEYLTAAYN